jgi:hypothetical protein
MDREHSVKALLIYPEFPGSPFNCEFYDLTLLYGEGRVSLLLHRAA